MLTLSLVAFAFASGLQAAAADTPRPTVAILPPVPSAAGEAWIGMVLADNLNTRLLVHSRFDPKTLQRLYPLNVFSWRQTLSAARAEDLEVGKALTPSNQKELVRQLGTDGLFHGTYVVQDQKIALSWRLDGGKKPVEEKTIITIGDMAPGVEQLVQGVLKALGQDPKSVGGHQLVSMPLAATKPYGEGLEIVAQQSLDPRARLMLPAAEIERAHARFEAATEVAPSFVHAWVERGLTSAMGGKMTRAEDEFVQAMAHAGEFEPANALGLYYLYSRQEKMAEAIQVLEEATSSHLGFLHGFGYLGTAYERVNATHKALEVFTQYNARVPKSPWARVMRARALARIGQHQLAIDETKAVLKDFPDSLMVTTALASRQIDAKDYAGAKLTIEQTLKTHPNHPALLTRLSYLELEAGTAEKALVIAQKAVEALGDGRGEQLAGYAHLNQAHALALLGRTAEAYVALKKALELGIGAEERMFLVRDPRLKAFLSDPKSPIKYTTEGVRAHDHDH